MNNRPVNSCSSETYSVSPSTWTKICPEKVLEIFKKERRQYIPSPKALREERVNVYSGSVKG
jgi:hypothetical protein